MSAEEEDHYVISPGTRKHLTHGLYYVTLCSLIIEQLAENHTCVLAIQLCDSAGIGSRQIKIYFLPRIIGDAYRDQIYLGRHLRYEHQQDSQHRDKFNFKRHMSFHH